MLWEALIEHLPLADNSADVVISNCVVNLSADKGQVLREAFRVLRPGGRMTLRNLMIPRTVPEGLAGPAFWSTRKSSAS